MASVSLLSISWRVLPVVIALQSAAPPVQSTLAQLPKNAAQVVSRQYPGWKVAGAASCSSAAPNPVSADFNGDGRPDWAVQLVKDAGERHLVVLIARLDDFEAFAVDQDAGDGALTAIKAGTDYVERGDALPDFFGTDAIGAGPCGKPDHAYLWMGTGFRRVELSAR